MGIDEDGRRREVVVACADVGSIANNRFGWARRSWPDGPFTGGTDIAALADSIADDLRAGTAVALGFECPLYVPVPEASCDLAKARLGEGNRSWSAGAGSGALATGVVQAAWLLREIGLRCSPQLVTDWESFSKADSALLVWEAFVSGRGKAAGAGPSFDNPHVRDAAAAVTAFCRALPSTPVSCITDGAHLLSLSGAAALWAGLSTDIDLLRRSCLVVQVSPGARVYDVSTKPNTVTLKRAGRR